MPIQAILVVSGKVQSVGYREYVYHQATRLNLTGLVRNIDEGKVWAVVEGEKDVIEQFKRDIWTKDAIAEVTDIRIDYGEAKGCYDTFLVTRDLRYNGLPESKMEEGIGYLKLVVEGINEMKTELGGKIDRMDANMAGHFERLGADISGNFDRLDSKYGEFGETMKGMAADIKVIRKAATKENGESATG